MDPSRRHKKIILYAVPGREPFYGRFGFLRIKREMATFENQRQQLELPGRPGDRYVALGATLALGRDSESTNVPGS